MSASLPPMPTFTAPPRAVPPVVTPLESIVPVIVPRSMVRCLEDVDGAAVDVAAVVPTVRVDRAGDRGTFDREVPIGFHGAAGTGSAVFDVGGRRDRRVGDGERRVRDDGAALDVGARSKSARGGTRPVDGRGDRRPGRWRLR